MPAPFDYTQCPEFAGPMTEPRSPGDLGATFDIQALHQGTVRLPQLDQAALARGEYVPVSRTEGLLDPETRERERHQAALDYDAGRDSMRQLFESAARHAGADPRVARRTADELMRQLPEAAAITEAAEPVTDPAAEAEVSAEPAAEAATTAAEPVLAAVPDAPPEPAGSDPDPNSSDPAVRTQTAPAAVRPRTKKTGK